MAETEDQRARQERRNFLKRKRLDEKGKAMEEATRAATEMKSAAILEAQTIKEKATQESRSIISSAKDREKVINACISSATQRWHELEKLLDSFQSHLPVPSRHTVGTSTKSPEQIREESAMRQRASYWKRIARLEEERQAEMSILTNPGVLPNRNPRMCRRVASDLLKMFSEKTNKYNVVTKKEILKKFWQNPLMKHLHPAKFGCPKMDASVKVCVLAINNLAYSFTLYSLGLFRTMIPVTCIL